MRFVWNFLCLMSCHKPIASEAHCEITLHQLLHRKRRGNGAKEQKKMGTTSHIFYVINKLKRNHHINRLRTKEFKKRANFNTPITKTFHPFNLSVVISVYVFFWCWSFLFSAYKRKQKKKSKRKKNRKDIFLLYVFVCMCRTVSIPF